LIVSGNLFSCQVIESNLKLRPFQHRRGIRSSGYFNARVLQVQWRAAVLGETGIIYICEGLKSRRKLVGNVTSLNFLFSNTLGDAPLISECASLSSYRIPNLANAWLGRLFPGVFRE